MDSLIDLERYPVKAVLERLLGDKTTKENIIFATDAYVELGEGFLEKSQITVGKLFGLRRVAIVPRVQKAADAQQARTRKKAEVFTPSWIVNKMNNHCDQEWFGKADVFNTETENGWITNPNPIVFDGGKGWQQYVDSRRLEITCGEAPYIVSRYDTTTGEIIPIQDRIGILDRKLRVVKENAADDGEWLKWAIRALQSSYGYEFQGDNLLIARINVLLSFVDYYTERFAAPPDEKLLKEVTTIICWNFWQMDGLTGTIPFSRQPEYDDIYTQVSFFDLFNEPAVQEEKADIAPSCKIWDWRKGNAVSYDEIRGGTRR